MSSLVIFSLISGAPLRMVMVPDELDDFQCGVDECAIRELDMPPGTDWVNFFLDINTYEIFNLPTRPNKYCVFDYAAKQWVDPRTPETEWPLIRAERDRRLLVCDWTQLPDVPIATREAWASYRQALRDVTLQPDPFNIVWPETP